MEKDDKRHRNGAAVKRRIQQLETLSGSLVTVTPRPRQLAILQYRYCSDRTSSSLMTRSYAEWPA